MTRSFDVYKVLKSTFDNTLRDHSIDEVSLLDQISTKSTTSRAIFKEMRKGLFYIPEVRFDENGRNKGCSWHVCRELEDQKELRIVTRGSRVPKYILREV